MFDVEYQKLIKETQEKGIIHWLKRHPSREILFHHRMPTSTDNVMTACHPFKTNKFFDTNYVLVHNGWLTNEDQLFQDHAKLGIDYASLQPDLRFNDSEALLWDFALYMEGKQEKMKARGAVAFVAVALKPDGTKQLHFYRNSSSPLNVHRNKKHLYLSSTGKGSSVPIDKLHTYDYQTKRLASSCRNPSSPM